ncbi:MAG: D-glycero-beta-D-manno-heptose 1-phosphate adenylyltransferase [Dehalococcoidia bacterium]|nr:D-glycero-beta-D-manno-heptose 1-phosphate adenylyltransferase [Dehalococcoidia bacterium]
MTEKVLPLEAVQQRCESWRAQGRRVVMTNGCFDLLHVGHVRYLRRARALGDALIVAVNDDNSVRELKGHGRPIVPEAERAEIVASLGFVNCATLFPEPTACNIVRSLRPDVYVKGGDYGVCAKSLPEAAVVAEYGGMVVLLEFEPGASTTSIIQRITQPERMFAPAPTLGGSRAR